MGIQSSWTNLVMFFSLILTFSYFKFVCENKWKRDDAVRYTLLQRSPTFLAPGTGFVEDNCSMDKGWGRGWFRRSCEWWGGMGRDAEGWGAMGSDGEGRGATGSDGERRGGTGRDGEGWGAADEVSLTSCCAARFLTGLRPVPVGGPGVGDPCSIAIRKEMTTGCKNLKDKIQKNTSILLWGTTQIFL